ncbi:MAG: ATP synthase F1 subunit delta [Candidatus Chisholmbacteria bacterium]|nr:ATP synthase F1 subunit delta [Candidatus Chisholmbacteria bacterium]
MTLTHSRVDAITRGFIKYLDKTGQIDLLPELARRHLRESRIKFDPHLAKVQTTIPLTPIQRRQLEDILSQTFHRPIKVKASLRPDLIGGMFIRIGDKVIDLSLKTKLDALQDSLVR